MGPNKTSLLSSNFKIYFDTIQILFSMPQNICNLWPSYLYVMSNLNNQKKYKISENSEITYMRSSKTYLFICYIMLSCCTGWVSPNLQVVSPFAFKLLINTSLALNGQFLVPLMFPLVLKLCRSLSSEMLSCNLCHVRMRPQTSSNFIRTA